MTPRFNLFESPTGAAFAKRVQAAGAVLTRGPIARGFGELVVLRASQINGCGVCVDMHTKEALAADETPLRINMVAAWRDSTVFTDAERAALALAEEGTRIADANDGVSDATWEQLRQHWNDDEVATLVCLVAMINAYNRMNVIVHNEGGSYEPGMFDH